MKLSFKPYTIGLFSIIAILLLASKRPEKTNDPVTVSFPNLPKIQAAILLDVSNSMDGLIEQAKAQLWNMVSVMGKAKCNETTPEIEIALYEYGRTTNDPKQGFVKQISGFTTDLDKLSQQLFNLTTDGGDEYCGQVIYSSLKNLDWDTANSNYKVIFIAGNEDFLQGNLLYTKACSDAKNKGVIVNTIYCGDRVQGIREHWNLNAECGNGSFTNINQDAKIEEIPTPYDSVIFALNDRLNTTYLTFGAHGESAFAAQSNVDKMNYNTNKSAAVKRVEVKGKKELYKNTTWDMVDAAEKDRSFADKVDMRSLPDSLKNKSRKEIKQLIDTKTIERAEVQKDIEEVTTKRQAYIVNEKKKSSTKQTATLESEVEKLIKKQAVRFKMVIP
ncbi:MAG: vWA domain-containing protein [Ferruginibacter sp.]